MTLITSCEDSNTTYLCLSCSSIRLVFHEGKYVGWYDAGGNRDEGA